MKSLSFLAEAEAMQQSAQHIRYRGQCVVRRSKLQFLGGLRYRRVVRTGGNERRSGVRVASPLDLLATQDCERSGCAARRRIFWILTSLLNGSGAGLKDGLSARLRRYYGERVQSA